MRKKPKHETYEMLLFKFFFVLAVLAVGIIFGTTYWYLSIAPAKLPISVAPEIVAVIPPDTQITIPQSREVSLCGITLTLPDISLSTLEQGDYFDGTRACVYRSNRGTTFAIMVADKTATSSIYSDASVAFDRYLETQNPKEIIVIAKTDSRATEFTQRTPYDKLAKNSVTYTGEVGPTIPGSGVYQTATYLDGRYLVYLTYNLFEANGSAWSLYFNKNYHAAIDWSNEKELFRTYTKKFVARPEVKSVIEEINASTLTIKQR